MVTPSLPLPGCSPSSHSVSLLPSKDKLGLKTLALPFASLPPPSLTPWGAFLWQSKLIPAEDPRHL